MSVMLRYWFVAILTMVVIGTNGLGGEEGKEWHEEGSPPMGLGMDMDELATLFEGKVPTYTRTMPAQASPTSTGLPCVFTFTSEASNSRYKYDICPLLHRHKLGSKDQNGHGSGSSEGTNVAVEVDETPIKIRIVEKTPPTLTARVYTLGLRGPLEVNGTLPAELQCPADTRICLVVENTRPSHPSEPKRRLQVVPVAGGPDMSPRAWRGPRKAEGNSSDSMGKLIRERLADVRSILSKSSCITCSPGENMSTKFRKHISHSFARTLRRLALIQLWAWQGTHAFEWKSHHACPTILRNTGQPNPGNPNEGTGSDDETPDAEPRRDVPEPPQERTISHWPSMLLLSLLVLLLLRLSLRASRIQTILARFSGRLSTLRPGLVLNWLSHFFRSKNEVIFDAYRPLDGMEEYNPTHRLEMVPLSPTQAPGRPMDSKRGAGVGGGYGSV